MAAAFVLAAASMTSTIPARADATSEAKERFDEGAKAFAERRYADAGEAYERAAALSPHPAPLVNAAEAWELDGNLVRAARACDAALRLDLGAAKAGVERRLARLERSVATLDVSGDPSLSVVVDDGVVLTPPARLRLSPGKHSSTLRGSTAPGGPPEVLMLLAGEHRHLVLETLAGGAAQAVPTTTAPVRAPNADATPAKRQGRASPPLGTWVAAGTGVAAAAGATVFAILTSSAQSDFDAHPTTAAADDFDRKRTVTNVLFVVSGVALLTAGAIWILTPRDSGAAVSTPLTRRLARGLSLTFD